MTELERALVALGRELDVPRSRICARAFTSGSNGGRGYRRALVPALALLVALGIAFAVPQARSAILRFFHIGAVTIERVETLPAAQRAARSPRDSGRRCRCRRPRRAPA